MKQHEAVQKVMEQNGGRATLAYLYQNATKVPGTKWGTKTPDASIRNIVQTYEDLFYRVRPGEWGLVSHQQELNQEAQDETKTHSFYQGLLLEIGKYRKLKTYVPAQDKNRLFRPSETLVSIADMVKMPEFTYPHIVNNIKSIDVVWFNARDLPHTAIEVEHSTDMTKSLVKFMELQDFYCQLVIAADIQREAFFQRQMTYATHAPIAKRVKFWSYERIADIHSSLAKQKFYEEQDGE